MTRSATSSSPPGRWEVLARAAAEPAAPESVATGRALLVVALGSDLYGLPVERVKEIVRPRSLTPVPHAPPTVRGLISLRGEVIQVLDLAACLGIAVDAPAAESRRARIVVLRGDEGPSVALRVDAVHDVWRVDEADLRPPPSGESEGVKALASRDGRFVSLVDVDRLHEGSADG